MGKRGVNLCQIAQYAHYPVVTGEGEDKNDDVDPTDDDSKKVCKTWKKVKDTKYKKALSKPIHDIGEAKAMCEKEKKCVGISCRSAKKCCMNAKAKGKKNAKYDAYK